MDRIRYDSLHKFIVSIGILVMILPFLLVGWIMKNQDFIMLKKNEIDQLTDTGKEIILTEQKYQYEIVSHPKLFSVVILVIFFIGLIITVRGIIGWKRVQEKEDKAKELSNEIMINQLKESSKNETEEKVKEEILEIEATESIQQGKNLKEKIKDYIGVEEYVCKCIKHCFRTYKVLTNVKVKENVIDCVALKQSYKAFDFIFEIKYTENIQYAKKNMKRIIEKTIRLTDNYYRGSGRIAKACIVLILDTDAEQEKILNKKYLEELEQAYIGIEFIISDKRNIEKELKSIPKV